MSTASDMAQQNKDKETLCKELESVSLEIKGLEKKKDWLKSRLDPLLKIGERIGLVEKIEVEKLLIDEDLLEKFIGDYGKEVEKARECNIKVLREKIGDNKAALASIPKSKSTQIRVGEKFGA